MKLHSIHQKWMLILVAVIFIPLVGCNLGQKQQVNELIDLARLSGDWIRVDGNNPDYNGMRVTVSGNEATITDAASASSFNVGDIKWRNIDPNGESSFAHEELGSDGNYYDGSITLVDDNTVEIRVNASGAGNVQRWIRDTGADALSRLQGSWLRTQSNNPSADGMIVEVKGSQGKLIDVAGTNFNVGDIKWKEINATGPADLNHKELGSDYNYYDASMKFVNDTTIELVIGSSGAGNAQTWVRYSGGGSGGGPSVTQELPCSITTPTVLSNGSAAVDYKVTCVIDIVENLTIEPGVVIEVEENGGFGIYDNGSITAVGLPTDVITIRGTNPAKGWWRGFHVETNSQQNKMEHVVIDGAGSNYVYCCNEKASLFFKGGKMALSNVTITNGSAIGIDASRDNTEFSNFEAVVITNHDGYPAAMHPHAIGDIDGLGSDFSGNTDDHFYIYAKNITKEISIPEINIPYLLEGEVLDVTEGLTIEAGVEMAVEEEGGIGVYDSGYLNLAGTSSKRIDIYGEQAVEGFWRGIHVETTSLNNRIDYTDISDAGQNYVYCCNPVATLFMKSGSMAITNSSIDNSGSYGIVARDAAQFTEFSSNIFTNNAEAPLYLAVNRVGELDGTGSTYSGNTDNYITIYNSDLDAALTWDKANIPYLIEQGTVIDIVDRVDIEAGTEIVFGENAGFGIYDNGIFNVEGTSGERVILRGRENLQGYWRGIHTETNSGSNLISYAEIANAGSNYVYCCNPKAALFVKSGQMTVENSIIRDNLGCGIHVNAAATLNENGNTYSNNADGNICN